MNKGKSRIDNSLIGVAGVHFVVSELSMRGLIALPTVRNTAGIDVVVTSTDGAWHANLQVKASKNKVSFWPISSRYKEMTAENTFYVFVRYLKKESRFEAFLESADRVAKETTIATEEAKRGGCADWAPCWYLPEDEDLMRVAGQWQESRKMKMLQYYYV